ncbi:MAG: hypothetical protein KAT38_05955 [Bacteroidales bacterium]|nr:hypothetical protein [Bacteroidales bacterium]
MATKFRKSPLVCLGISLLSLLLRRLRYSKQYLGNTVKMEDSREFTIFRHITAYPIDENETTSVFIEKNKIQGNVVITLEHNNNPDSPR